MQPKVKVFCLSLMLVVFVGGAVDGQSVDLVYLTSDNDQSKIVRLQTSTGNSQVLPLDSEIRPFGLKWDQSRQRLVFASSNSEAPNLFAWNDEQGVAEKLFPNPSDEEVPDWSPDGKLIVYSREVDGNRDLFLANSDGTSMRRLTRHRAADKQPVWASDSTTIVFVSGRDGSEDIFSLNVNTNEIQKLVGSPAMEGHPAVSSTGKVVFFRYEGGKADLLLSELDGAKTRQITDTTGNELIGRLSPDETHLAFGSNKDGNWEIYLRDLSNSKELRLTNKESFDGDPIWIPRDAVRIGNPHNPNEQPSQGIERFLNIDGVKIRFTDEGQGEPVILLHGFAANAELHWRAPGTTPALAKTNRVIAIDLRGHGQSDKPHRPQDYGKKMGEDVIRIMDELKINKAHIVGYSMGGFVVMKLMITHPQRFISATLGGSGGIRPDYDSSWNDAMVKRMHKGFSFIDSLQESLPLDQKIPKDQMPMIKVVLGDLDPKALIANMQSWHHLSVSYRQLKANRIPVLLVYGDREEKVTLDYIEALKGKIGNARFRLIKGANHSNSITNPEFQSAIFEFIKTHSRENDRLESQ